MGAFLHKEDYDTTGCTLSYFPQQNNSHWQIPVFYLSFKDSLKIQHNFSEDRNKGPKGPLSLTWVQWTC